MAHFAEITSAGTVVRVLKVADAQESRGQEFLAVDLGLGGTWVQTSYNTRRGVHIHGGTPLRKNFACAGFTYDAQRDAFIPPRPSGEGWSIDEETCTWLR